MGVTRSPRELAQAARTAARALRSATTAGKNAALTAMAARLRATTPAIVGANAEDLARADAAGITPALRDRLRLDPARIDAMAAALEEIATLPDPLAEPDRFVRRPNGLFVGRRRIPLGVV